MSSEAQRLTKLLHDHCESNHFAKTSRWYNGLSKVISFFKRAEANTDALDRFRDAWAAAYNLFTQHGGPGDEEFQMLNRWVSSLQDVPAVRRLFDDRAGRAAFADFLTRIGIVKKALLRVEGEKTLNNWQSGQVSSVKACRYFFIMMQDIRNRIAHPDFNPAGAKIQNALAAAAHCLMLTIIPAVEAMIEQPVPGTTGRTVIRSFFLWPFLKNTDSFFSDYYLERLFPDEEMGAYPEEAAKEDLKELRRAMRERRDVLAKDGLQKTIDFWCKSILFNLLKTEAIEGVSLVAADVTSPSFVIAQPGAAKPLKHEYLGKEMAEDIACLIWVLPWRGSLDAILEDPSGRPAPVLEMANRALTVTDVPWAVLTNGKKLRLLSRQTAHKPRSFLEIDLEAITDPLSDQKEALKAFRYLLGLFSGEAFTAADDKGLTRLVRVRSGSERHGKEIGDELKQNVFKALEQLGEGLLYSLRSKPEETRTWCLEKELDATLEECLASEDLLAEIYHESLSMMYRLLFLFYAESRNLLPLHNELYQENYSLESLRDEIISVHDDPDPKHFFSQGQTVLWDRLQELFKLINEGWGEIVPAYNGGLFDPEQHPFLERFQIPDYFLARAIDLLSRTQPSFGQGRGEGRKKVTYRDLDVRHLGSIYEGILEYNAQIADQDFVVIKRGTGVKTAEEYAPVEDLSAKEKEELATYRKAAEEDPDYPNLPRAIKITGFKERGKYFLVFGGRESKRKSSGSYYTPDYIVQYIVENTLGPLVRGECRPQPEPLAEELKKIGIKEQQPVEGPLTSDEILDLKVLDPAMGSGHFLVAATEYLARAYGEALIREGKDEDGILTDHEFTRFKRIVAERCIYGVDINPMAVELAKLSLWLTTMDPGRPLSFLDHHLKCGNSLMGAWIDDLGELPECDNQGKTKRRKRSVARQKNTFLQQFLGKLPAMLQDVFKIMGQETMTLVDNRAKKALAQALEEIKRPFKNTAHIWLAYHFGDKPTDYAKLLTNIELGRAITCMTAQEYKFFHWELEFPEVWFDKVGNHKMVSSGFSAIMGNPPYLLIESFGKASPLASALSFLYEDIWQDKSDLVMFFLERSCQLSHLVTMIVKNSILAADKARLFRSKINKKNILKFVVDFRNIKIFPDAQVATCIIGLGPSKTTRYFAYKDSITDLIDNIPSVVTSINPGSTFDVSETVYTNEDPWLRRGRMLNIYSTQHASFTPLGSVFEIGEGMQTGFNKAFEIRADLARDISRFCRPRIEGKTIKRYHLEKGEKYLLWVEDAFDFKELPGWIQEHLLSHEIELRSRAAFIRGNCAWYRFTWPLHKDKYSQLKLWTSYRNKRNAFALERDILGLGLTDTTVIFAGRHEKWLPTVLGLLNSTYLTLQYRQIGKMTGGGVYEYFKNGIAKILIPNEIRQSKLPNLENEITTEMLNDSIAIRRLIERFPDPSSPEARERYLAIIGLLANERTRLSYVTQDGLDKKTNLENCIDLLVCKLYGFDFDLCKDVALGLGA